MHLELFAEKINTLSEIESYEKRDNVTVDQARFTIKKMRWFGNCSKEKVLSTQR